MFEDIHFVYGLQNDSVNSSDYVASNDTMTGK